MKKIAVGISTMLVYLMKPFKVYAYTSGMGFPGRLIIQITAFVDFFINFTLGSNKALLLHQKVYGGNFIFGQGVMKVDHQSIEREIQLLSPRKNIIGSGVVSALGDAFVTNAAMTSLGEPVRTQVREYLDKHYFLPELKALSWEDLQTKCAVILEEWVEGENPEGIVQMRSVATRMIIFLTAGILISKKDAEQATKAYLKGLYQVILLKHFPLITGLIGTEKRLKKDAFFPLRKLGVPNPVIDYTLFAGMLSIGTLFIQCVKDIRTYQLDFGQLDPEQKMKLIMESIRRQPTVPSVQRVVVSAEEIEVSGKKITLTGGDMVHYPLVCANTDDRKFKCPHQFDMNRSREEHDNVLSWSKGPHNCPVKDLSLQITLTMLDSLHKKTPLSMIKY